MNLHAGLVAAFIALAVPAGANAAIQFDPDGGANNWSTITGFEWGPTSVLTQGANQAIAGFISDPHYNPITATLDPPGDPTQYKKGFRKP